MHLHILVIIIIITPTTITTTYSLKFACNVTVEFRGVYITDCVVVEIGRQQVANLFFHKGEREFRLFAFSHNCEIDFVQTFSIDSTHRHGGHIKISQMGNSLT